MDIKENINLLFAQCCIALRGDHQIKLVNALQTLCALVRAVYRKRLGDHGFDVINILIGFDAAEAQMQGLLESLHTFLVGDYPVSLKNLSLKLALILVTATDNVSQNTIVEYIMINSIFEAVIQVLADPVARQQHGYEAMLLLTVLVNYRKYEASNPYIGKLSILDDELALNGFGCVISAALTDYNRRHAAMLEQASGGLISSITSFGLILGRKKPRTPGIPKSRLIFHGGFLRANGRESGWCDLQGGVHVRHGGSQPRWANLP